MTIAKCGFYFFTTIYDRFVCCVCEDAYLFKSEKCIHNNDQSKNKLLYSAIPNPCKAL